MDELVIAISPVGQVVGMHTDQFDLGFLGNKRVVRQTEIKFDEETQTWDIVLIGADGTHHVNTALNGFAGYEAAREFEVQWINACRFHRIHPEYPIGMAYAAFLRFGALGEDRCFTLPDGSCIADDCMHSD